jgi:hypothetical protein
VFEIPEIANSAAIRCFIEQVKKQCEVQKQVDEIHRKKELKNEKI